MVKKEDVKKNNKQHTTKNKINNKNKNIKEAKKSSSNVKPVKAKEERQIKIDANAKGTDFVEAKVNANSKKYNKFDLLKWIGGLFLILVILTWVIKSGQFSSGELVLSDYESLGILDLIRIPISTLINYANYGVLILFIGGLYGVMKKTGVYDALVAKIVKCFAHRSKVFLAITVTFFGLLSSLTSLQWVIIILVPLFVSVLRNLHYSKLSSLMATVGAILVGNIGCIYGFNVAGYTNYYLNLGVNDDIFTKVILLIMLIVILTLYINKNNKTEELEQEESIDAELLKKGEKRSIWPLVSVLGLVMVLLVVACYNWEYAIGFSSFTDLYESIVSNYAWINNIIGQYSPFGYWNTTEIIMVLLVASGLIAWLYSLKLKDACDAFVSGCKKALRPAIYVALASVIIYAVLGTSTGNNIYFTISNAILGLSESVHALVMSLFSFVSGLFLNDYSYLIGYMTTPLTSVYTDTTMYSYMALILQTIYGFVMLFVPTSLLLVGGLSYLKINYKDYLKYVWLFLLQVLVISLIIFVVMAMFM